MEIAVALGVATITVPTNVRMLRPPTKRANTGKHAPPWREPRNVRQSPHAVVGEQGSDTGGHDALRHVTDEHGNGRHPAKGLPRVPEPGFRSPTSRRSRSARRRATRLATGIDPTR